MSDPKIFYLCDMAKDCCDSSTCGKNWGRGCLHTSDINHAKNFIKEETSMIPTYIETASVTLRQKIGELEFMIERIREEVFSGAYEEEIVTKLKRLFEEADNETD